MDSALTAAASALSEPVARPVLALLRRAVLDHADSERRRVFAPVVHVGTPGVVERRLELGDQRLDLALRVDAVEAMWRATRHDGAPCLVWLTRPGSLEVRDVDHAWSAAARTAGAELGTTLPMVVVNRRSWRDPSSGVAREWTRVRS